MPKLLRPLWLTGHALVALAAYAMVELALWQWDRATETGAVSNYSYSIEWYVFAALTVIGWAKMCHDELVPDPQAGILHGAVEPAISAAEMATWDDDPEVAAWNAQFRALNLRHALKEAGITDADIRQQLADHDTHRPLADHDTRRPLADHDTRRPLADHDTHRPLADPNRKSLS